MNPHYAIVSVLLWIAVGSTFFSCVAMLAAQNLFPRLHYMAPIADISMVALMLAVAVQEGWGQAFIKTVLILLVTILMNAVLAHATARAARVRRFGRWTPQPGEAITSTRGRGQQARQDERRRNE